jgi:hypothetical protein
LTVAGRGLGWAAQSSRGRDVKFSILLKCAAGLTLLAATPALAAPNDGDARMAAAERLLTAMKYDSQIDRTIDAIVAEVERTIDVELNKKLPEPLPPEVLAKIKALTDAHMRQTFADHRLEVRRGTALIYARHFTVAELDHMAALQSDPVMVKMQAEIPQIMAETMALSQAMIAGGQEQLQADVRAVVEDYLSNKGKSPSS